MGVVEKEFVFIFLLDYGSLILADLLFDYVQISLINSSAAWGRLMTGSNILFCRLLHGV